MEYQSVKNLLDFQNILKKNNAVLIYFSHEKCEVCQGLKPKVKELINAKFKKIKLFYVDVYKRPEVAAQNGIFISPTILFFCEGNETLRISRNIGIDELKKKISKPYKLMYSLNG